MSAATVLAAVDQMEMVTEDKLDFSPSDQITKCAIVSMLVLVYKEMKELISHRNALKNDEGNFL